MRFYDEVTITVQSGKGGDGIVTGRRETGIPFGGPSGGNGGKGGSIILQANKDENTLLPYKYRKNFKAIPGENGRSKEQYGANAQDLFLTVPVGTIIKNKKNNQILYYFTKDKETFVVLKGGDGGVGNMHFKNPVNQYPTFCLLGEPGQKMEIVLELQLLADVALIGTPSVGKSTIINAISHTKAKTADYPFTTLIPNLGSVNYRNHTFNVIDIPGLIKGAAKGKGLGNEFLRHILKSKIFCIICDISRYNQGITEIPDLMQEIIEYINQKFSNENNKLKIYIQEDKNMLTLFAENDGKIILEKRILFLINKYDLVNDDEILKEYKNQMIIEIIDFLKKNKIGKKITKNLIEKNIFVISAATHFGIDKWLDNILNLLDGTNTQEVYNLENIKYPYKKFEKRDMITEITEKEIDGLVEKGYIDKSVSKFCKVWEINSAEICKLVWITRRGNDEAENWFWKTLDSTGHIQIFEKMGIKKGDILKIISHYEDKDDRYIQR